MYYAMIKPEGQYEFLYGVEETDCPGFACLTLDSRFNGGSFAGDYAERPDELGHGYRVYQIGPDVYGQLFELECFEDEELELVLDLGQYVGWFEFDECPD
ncbi:MAG: hypothetical protein ABIJ57_00130 [Pseudomonadota bacterium]